MTAPPAPLFMTPARRFRKQGVFAACAGMRSGGQFGQKRADLGFPVAAMATDGLLCDVDLAGRGPRPQSASGDAVEPLDLDRPQQAVAGNAL